MYEKISLTIAQQIAQLKQRGMLITDDDLATHFLSHISYYRLAGYWWPMQEEPKEQYLFKSNSKFEDVILLYNFDRELRIITFDAIEKIEISLRTKLIYHLSHEIGAWWFQNLEIFQNVPEAVKTLAVLKEEIERSKDIIAKELGLINHTFLPSWLQSIAQIRNYCAHHSRLWNKNLPGRPKLPSNPPNSWLTSLPKENEMHMLYVHLCCIRYLLNVVQPANNFKVQLVELLNKYPNVDSNALGIPINWLKEPLWS